MRLAHNYSKRIRESRDYTFNSYDDFYKWLDSFDFSKNLWKKSHRMGQINITNKVGGLQVHVDISYKGVSFSFNDGMDVIADTYLPSGEIRRIDIYDFEGDGSNLLFDFLKRDGHNSFKFK